jgi:hypothetical protein
VPCTIEGDKTVFINPAAFTLVGTTIGEVPTQGRSTCLGSPHKNIDFSVYKNFSPGWLTSSFLGEAARVQFRFEIFNAFNNPQFRGDTIGFVFFDGTVACGTAACSPTNRTITGFGSINPAGTFVQGPPNQNFGVAGNTRGGREIQYALKLVF